MLPRHPASLLVARALLASLGIGVPGALVACGGKVVFDEGGSGGDGSVGVAGSTHVAQGSTALSSSASTGGCTPKDPPPANHTYETHCLFLTDDACAPASAPQVLTAISSTVNNDMPCPVDPDFCSCSTTVTAVLCEAPPAPGPVMCCYLVDVWHQQVCEGRPFVVDRVARVAPVVRGNDWRVECTIDVSGLDGATKRALSLEWARDAAMEHASVASFARFALELLAVGAPAELVRGAHEAALDEVRHAELCFGLASAFGESDLQAGALSIDGAFSPRIDLGDLAVATVREGCVGETVAAMTALEAAELADSPLVREVLTSIAADEARHAALAYRFVSWAISKGGPEVRSRVADAFAMPSFTDVGASDELALDVMLAQGRLPAARRKAVAHRALTEVVGPLAATMFATPLRETPVTEPSRVS